MLTNATTSAGIRLGLDSASIQFTLACLHRAGINEAKQQQCRANTGRGDQPNDCIGASNQNDESILSEKVEGREQVGEEEEGWGEEVEEWEEEEGDSEWEEDEEEEWEEEEDEDDDEAWDEEQQAWADCLEQQGIPCKVYKYFLRAASNLNVLIERLNGLNGCKRLAKALIDDQRRRVLLKLMTTGAESCRRSCTEQLVHQGHTPESARQWVQDAVEQLQLKVDCSEDMLRTVRPCCVCVRVL